MSVIWHETKRVVLIELDDIWRQVEELLIQQGNMWESIKVATAREVLRDTFNLTPDPPRGN